MNVDIKQHKSYNFFDHICDEVEKMYGMRSFVANI